MTALRSAASRHGWRKLLRWRAKPFGGQFQRQQVLVDPGAEVAPEDQGRDRDDQAEGGVVQGDRDAVGQLGRVAAGGAAGGDCEPKISIMPTTVPNRPISGRRRGDGGQRAQVALQAVGHDATGAFQGGVQVHLRCMRGSGSEGPQAAGQHLAQGGILLQLRRPPQARAARLRDAARTSSSSWGGAILAVLRLRKRSMIRASAENGADDQGPDRPASGLYDGKQGDPPRKNALRL